MENKCKKTGQSTALSASKPPVLRMKRYHPPSAKTTTTTTNSTFNPPLSHTAPHLQTPNLGLQTPILGLGRRALRLALDLDAHTLLLQPRTPRSPCPPPENAPTAQVGRSLPGGCRQLFKASHASAEWGRTSSFLSRAFSPASCPPPCTLSQYGCSRRAIA
eukprot:2638410-Rhodomonas_salina.4